MNVIDKLDFTYETQEHGSKTKYIELPFKLLILGAFSSRAFKEDNPWSLYNLPDTNIDAFLSSLNLSLDLHLANFLYPKILHEIKFTLQITSIDSTLLDGILHNTTHINSAYLLLSELKYLMGDDTLFHQVLYKDENAAFFDLPTNDSKLLNLEEKTFLIADLEKRIFQQVNTILADDKFKQVEANWRSVKFLFDQVDDHYQCHIDILDISKEMLVEDCVSNRFFYETNFYNFAYTHELGQFGGLPYSIVIDSHEFSNQNNDIEALRVIAQVCATSHTPFISSASASIWSLKSYNDFFADGSMKLPAIKKQKMIKWQNLLQDSNSKYLFLTMPRVKSRSAYHYGKNDTQGLHVIETDNEDGVLWTRGAFCIAHCLIKTFNDYKSGLGITAEHGCISKLGKPQLWLDYQSSLSIMEQGFIPLFYNKVQEGIIFYSLPSISSTLFTNKKITSEISLGQQLVNQLPYLMMIARVLQYLRVIQRDTIGTNDLQVVKKILNEWLGTYVSDMENPKEDIRIKRPLRYAEVDFSMQDIASGNVEMSLKISPHMQYYGKNYSLFLDTKITT